MAQRFINAGYRDCIPAKIMETEFYVHITHLYIVYFEVMRVFILLSVNFGTATPTCFKFTV